MQVVFFLIMLCFMPFGFLFRAIGEGFIYGWQILDTFED